MNASSLFKTREAWNFPGLLVCGLVAVMAWPVSSAYAQSVNEMQNRIQRLENDIETLSRAVYKGETPPPGAFSGGAGGADTEIRLQQMESEMRQMRGQIEELSFENKQLRGELERVTGDLQMQMQDMGAGNGGGSSYVPPSSSTSNTGGASSSAAPATSGDGYQWSSGNISDNSPSGQLGSITQSPSGAVNPTGDQAAIGYDNAYAMLKNKQYERAQGAFEAFLKSYPDHALAGNAKYWLGETHYVRGQYETAARIFAEGYQQYPKSSKTSDNLLKLGMSLGALGKTEDACIALSQLSKENLPGSAPVMRRAEQEQSRLGCS